MKEFKLLRQDFHQPEIANYHSRSYSAVDYRPSTPTNVILKPEIYEEDLKSYIDVTELLVSVSRAEAESRSIEEQEIVSQIKAESIDARNRIQVSIERNKSKGAQIARAEIPQSSRGSRKRPESESGDSGYATSVRSFQLHENHWFTPASSSRQPTNRASGSSEQTWNWPTFSPTDSRRPSQQSSSVSKTVIISQAFM